MQNECEEMKTTTNRPIKQSGKDRCKTTTEMQNKTAKKRETTTRKHKANANTQNDKVAM